MGFNKRRTSRRIRSSRVRGGDGDISQADRNRYEKHGYKLEKQPDNSVRLVPPKSFFGRKELGQLIINSNGDNVASGSQKEAYVRLGGSRRNKKYSRRKVSRKRR